MPRLDFAPLWVALAAIILFLTGTAEGHWRQTHVAHSEPGESRRCIGTLREDAEDGQLDRLSFLDAALIASGVNDAKDLDDNLERFNKLCNAALLSVQPEMSDQERLLALFRQLHQDFLTRKYSPDASLLDRTLQTGDYNCVTATVLLIALAERCELELQAIASGAHVFCSFPVAEPLYIEPTCRDWRLQTLSTCPPKMKSLVQSGRPLTKCELLGKIFYNRGVAAVESEDFPRAIELLLLASEFDSGDLAARENLAAAYNNWALHWCDRHQFDRAVECIVSGLAIDSDYPPLLENDLYVHQRWVKALCARGDYASSISILRRAQDRRPSSEWFADGVAAVFYRWAYDRFEQQDFDGGWSVMEAAAQSSSSSTMTVRMFQRIIEDLSRSGHSASADRLRQEMPRRLSDLHLPDRKS